MNTQTLLSIVADQREELLANDYEVLCSRPEESQLDLKSNRAQVVIGVRRCGKSTLCGCELNNHLGKVKEPFTQQSKNPVGRLLSGRS